MRTEMHQDAFPGEDISDRPGPETSVPGLAGPDHGRPTERTLRGARGGARGSEGVMTTTTARPHPPPGLRRSTRRTRPTSRPRRRGRRRDHGRLLVSRGARARRSTPASTRSAAFLDPGDLVVVNTSATVPAALDGRLPDGEPVVVHLSGELPGGRGSSRSAARPRHHACRSGSPRDRRPDRRRAPRRRSRAPADAVRRTRPASGWRRSTSRPPVAAYLARHGRPIRYRHVPARLADRRVPDRVRRRAGQRRDAEREPAVHPRARDRAGHAGHPLRAARSCTPACRRSRAASAPTPSGTACRATLRR